MTKENKTCTKCKQTKPVAEFYKQKARPDGLDAYCKDCRKATTAEYMAARPDYAKNYYHRVQKPRRMAEKQALERLRELDPTWEPQI